MKDKIKIIVKKISLIVFLLTTIVVMGYASFFLVLLTALESWFMFSFLSDDYRIRDLAITAILACIVFILLKRQKFIPSTIMAFLFPVLSPIVFAWLEFHLFKQKKWLWFWYMMIAYVVLLGSGYYWFKNVIIYAT